tara:strand:- start:1233 stop:1460 length:228 start_codon:yes stop_codon:yes gene_type:complete
MTSPYEWGRKNEREQLGQLIKSVVEKRDVETLAKWYQTLGKALEIVKEDGRYSREGLHQLDSLEKGIKYLITEVK